MSAGAAKNQGISLLNLRDCILELSVQSLPDWKRSEMAKEGSPFGLPSTFLMGLTYMS